MAIPTPLPPPVAITRAFGASPSQPQPTPQTISSPGTAAPPPNALTQAIIAALPLQNSMAPLLATLATLTARSTAAPVPVLQAAHQIVAAQLPLQNQMVDAAALQRAILDSGIFQEARLAAGAAPTSDLKTILLTLRSTLLDWVGNHPVPSPANVPPPPLRGIQPRAARTNQPQLDPGLAPTEIGRHLLDHTESALSRLRLHQAASLPDPATPSKADWSMDLPVLIGTYQTIMQIQISRDDSSAGNQHAECGWQFRFALDVPGLGEVGAQVSHRAGATGIMLWSADQATTDALQEQLPVLRDTLQSAGVRTGTLIVRQGVPLAQPTSPVDHFVDTLG